MQKGFTLAETLITMAVIGIIMALSIPAVIQSTNDTAPLFKKAYNSVEEVVSELVNDTSMYPDGEFGSETGTNTFCNNFFSKLNTIGYVNANCSNTFVETLPGVPVATTSNAMNWYGIQNNFTAARCEMATTGINDTVNTCLKIRIDVNGENKGANINAAQSNKDIFTLYITKLGQVAVAQSAANTWDEAYILQH